MTKENVQEELRDATTRNPRSYFNGEKGFLVLDLLGSDETERAGPGARGTEGERR